MAENTRLYVGNLSYNATQEELTELFSSVGNVISAVIINDRETGRSRGFGFVELETDEEVQEAIERLHGQPFQGRNLVVNEARPRQDR